MALAVFKPLRSSALVELVDEGAALDARMKIDQVRMAEIKTALIEKGPGEYFGSNGRARALVIFPAPRIVPKPQSIPALEKFLTKPIFQTLFKSTTIWKPVKSCRDVAAAILPKSVFSKFRTLAETDSPAQVRFG
jgi:hypothetical protein